MSQYTKGEWEANIGMGAPSVSVKDKPGRPDKVIALIRLFNGSEDLAEAEANTRLIAAAPEMYKALKAIKNLCDGYTELDKETCSLYISKILAKAEGK